MEVTLEPDEILQIAALLRAVERDPDLTFKDIDRFVIEDNAVSIYFRDNKKLKEACGG